MVTMVTMVPTQVTLQAWDTVQLLIDVPCHPIDSTYAIDVCVSIGMCLQLI